MDPLDPRTHGADPPDSGTAVHFEMVPLGGGTIAPEGPLEAAEPPADAAAPFSPPSIQIPPPPVVAEHSAPTAAASPEPRVEPPPGPHVPGQTGWTTPGTQPMFSGPRDGQSPGHRAGAQTVLTRLSMLPMRLLAVAGATVAFGLSAWQVSRVINELPRLGSLAWGSLVAAILGAIGVISWTWVVVENARRVMSPATTQERPEPAQAAATWLIPLAYVAFASGLVTYLSRRYNTPIEGTESSMPLFVAIAAVLIALPVMYGPANYLTGVVRKVGGHGIKLGQWLLVPVALAAVGAMMIFGLRAGGAFGEEFDGLAPTWVVGVAAIVPATVVVLLGWRAAQAVETDVIRAFDRRLGTNSSLTMKRSRFSAMYSDDGPNHAVLRTRGYLRQIPGASLIGIAISASLAGLALLSVVAAVVMYLFWQEGRDGVLLATQTDRAWELLSMLRSAERALAVVAVVLATLWTALVVTNVRLASARRRNPLVAALMWPVAAVGIWIVSDRLLIDGTVGEVVVGFAAQAVFLYLPFAALERAADAVGGRRNPFRLAYAIGVILLIHIEGLGGLSTLAEASEKVDVGRLAGYLAIGALIELFVMFTVTDATRSLDETAYAVAAQHNSIVEQRAKVGARQAESYDVRNVG